MNNSDFFKSINPGSAAETVISHLKSFKQRIEAADSSTKTTTSEIATQVDESIKSVTMMDGEINRLTTLVNLYQEVADAQIHSLSLIADTTINDYKSAYEATIYYDKNWFSNTLFSQDGKITLASHLFTTISQYCQDNIETLQMIKDGDSDILKFIRYPRQN